MPGVVGASMLVFIPTLGLIFISDLMGGAKTMIIGNLIKNQFLTARDWPFGAMASIILMVVTLLLIYSFLYIPIFTLIFYSFNDSKLNAVWKGFTLDWYVKLWSNTNILDAAKVSITVGITSTIVATMLGTLLND